MRDPSTLDPNIRNTLTHLGWFAFAELDLRTWAVDPKRPLKAQVRMGGVSAVRARARARARACEGRTHDS